MRCSIWSQTSKNFLVDWQSLLLHLFQNACHLLRATLSDIPLIEDNVWTMVNLRAKAASIDRPINCHTFRPIEIAQQMAGHASPTTKQLYDRRNDDVALDEVERI